MRDFVLFLLIVGLGIVVIVGSMASGYVEFRRRRDHRRQSARAMAFRFRRRYGAQAEAAALKSLSETNLSRRQRKFFKLVVLELRGASNFKANSSETIAKPRRSTSPGWQARSANEDFSTAEQPIAEP